MLQVARATPGIWAHALDFLPGGPCKHHFQLYLHPQDVENMWIRNYGRVMNHWLPAPPFTVTGHRMVQTCSIRGIWCMLRTSQVWRLRHSEVNAMFCLCRATDVRARTRLWPMIGRRNRRKHWKNLWEWGEVNRNSSKELRGHWYWEGGIVIECGSKGALLLSEGTEGALLLSEATKGAWLSSVATEGALKRSVETKEY